MEKDLERFKISFMQAIEAKNILAQVKIEVRQGLIDIMAGQVVFAIHGYIWAENLDTATIQYPLDWWQAFKERWFPGWLIKRYPVKYRIHIFDMKVLYPNYHKHHSIPGEDYKMRINERAPN